MKPTYYVKIDPSGAVAAGEFGEEQNTLKWLQSQVGGFIEVTAIPHRPGFLMILNEEGKNYHLPENRKATLLADCLPFDVICGQVLILKAKREELAGLSFAEAVAIMDTISA